MAYRQRRKPEPLDEPMPSQDDANPSNQPAPSSTLAEQETHAPGQLAAAVDRIADLEAQCRALRQRATTLELQQETAQRRMAAMELALRRLRAMANDSAAARNTTPSARGAADKKASEADGTPSIELLPWMMPSAEDLAGQVPKWTVMSEDFMSTVDTQADRMLEQFPEALMVLGLSSSAVQIRKWQRSESRAFRRIAHAIARRIICTDKTARKTESQMREFVRLTVKSLDLPHASESTGDKAAWAQLLAEGSTTLAVVTGFLLQKFQDADWMAGTSR